LYCRRWLCNDDYGCGSGGDLVVTTPTVSTVVILVAAVKELYDT
jgi:hypothetical protein